MIIYDSYIRSATSLRLFLIFRFFFAFHVPETSGARNSSARNREIRLAVYDFERTTREKVIDTSKRFRKHGSREEEKEEEEEEEEEWREWR